LSGANTNTLAYFGLNVSPDESVKNSLKEAKENDPPSKKEMKIFF
jgi:hypothetical protein